MTRSKDAALGARAGRLAVGIGCALVMAGATIGCARGPDVGATGLGLRRVVLYRNGVGYFERAGHVDEAEVTFRVRKDMVGDFLATLAVMEAGGSSVQSVSFPVEVVRDDEPEEEEEAEPAPMRSDLPFRGPSAPPKPRKKARSDALETVKLTLDGEEHDLVVGYVAETPVWRPSYRLVLGEKRAGGDAATITTTADLQAWGIVQNLSGEDWEGVRLSLVAGAPLAFQATLEKAVIPVRPIVSDQGEVISSVPMGETSLAEAPPPPPASAPMPAEMMGELDEDASAPSGGFGGLKKDKAAEGRASAVTRRPAMPAAPMLRPDAMSFESATPSAPRNVSALAAVAVNAGTTRYDLPFTVDIPNESATMVLLTSTKVPGEGVFLFAPDGGVPDSRSHPFRVARFKNSTPGLLERGPIAVFEKGAFLGQGMVEPLPPGATATVPFALERSLAVDLTRTEDQLGARLAKIEGGAIEIERDWVTHTKYAMKSGSDEAARTIVKHTRMPGTRLHEPPRGTEDNLGTGSALVPLDVPPRGTAVLDVDERRSFRRGIDLMSSLADDAVKGYLADPRASRAVADPLRAAWELRDKLRVVLDELEKLGKERNELERQSDELRGNLRAIEKNKTADVLRKELTDRLARASARLDEITKRVIVVEMSQGELSIRLRDQLALVRLDEPLAPVKG